MVREAGEGARCLRGGGEGVEQSVPPSHGGEREATRRTPPGTRDSRGLTCILTVEWLTSSETSWIFWFVLKLCRYGGKTCARMHALFFRFPTTTFHTRTAPWFNSFLTRQDAEVQAGGRRQGGGRWAGETPPGGSVRRQFPECSSYLPTGPPRAPTLAHPHSAVPPPSSLQAPKSVFSGASFKFGSMGDAAAAR